MDKRLADSEWVILKALWGKPPQTMKQIVENVRSEQPEVNWSYKTYHTYLRNMCDKGIIKAEDRNLKDKLYSPLVSEKEALLAEGGELLSRKSYFGSVGRLVMTMAESGQLSEKDRSDLIMLAQKLEEDKEGGGGNER